jgi:Molybdate transporter of MFS superfamily
LARFDESYVGMVWIYALLLWYFLVLSLGSGGLAAQYSFGARTGWSVVILGCIKLLSGLLFGDSLSELFKQFPKSMIGVLLVVAGLQIALVTVNLGSYKSISKKEDAYLIMILTATSIVGFANDGIGFLIGSVATVILHYTNVDVADIESSLAVQDATVVSLESEPKSPTNSLAK